MLQDNLEFFDGKSKVIFNHYSFTELVKYVSKTYEEADEIVNASFLNNQPKNFSSVVFYTHELEFYWAMLVAHGDMYWLKGIPSDTSKFQKEYRVWEDEIKQKYNLKDSYLYVD